MLTAGTEIRNRLGRQLTRYDKYAVQQITRNIELLRYRRYGGDLLLLELVRCSGR